VQQVAQRDGKSRCSPAVRQQCAGLPVLLVRPPRPTYTAWPSLQHIAAVQSGCLVDRSGAQAYRPQVPAPATSGQRAGTPGRASTATSSQTTPVSSVNTKSGQPSSGTGGREDSLTCARLCRPPLRAGARA
jgi:hypothetical protein